MLWTSSPAQGQARPPLAPTHPSTSGKSCIRALARSPRLGVLEVSSLVRAIGASGAVWARVTNCNSSHSRSSRGRWVRTSGCLRPPLGMLHRAGQAGRGRSESSGGAGVLPVNTDHAVAQPLGEGHGGRGHRVTGPCDPCAESRNLQSPGAMGARTTLLPSAKRWLLWAKLASTLSPFLSHLGFPLPPPLSRPLYSEGATLNCSPSASNLAVQARVQGTSVREWHSAPGSPSQEHSLSPSVCSLPHPPQGHVLVSLRPR